MRYLLSYDIEVGTTDIRAGLTCMWIRDFQQKPDLKKSASSASELCRPSGEVVCFQ
jgi:hypothetical protein